ncbi:MAG: AmmeMemoRadiSam system protein A [Caldiserica bacterium]|jgi:AmmeMemoRadiSam system protein A|nr:AmmeMemoRadiSam system protein A [Caldisericota bacterium]MDH7562479.1 AmmeMemoRadiSam system protein A [Caldisericota bacterium]
MAKSEEHPLVKLARRTIEEYLKTGKVSRPGIPHPEGLPQKAATFVSLKKRGMLRGCIGTLSPQSPTLEEEVQRNAISAATQDPRFPPVHISEVPELEISVDVLSPPEPVKSLDELDPRAYGVIVESGWRKGVLLPDLEGVDTVEEQLEIARRKAGILETEPYKIYRFKVQRLK